MPFKHRLNFNKYKVITMKTFSVNLDSERSWVRLDAFIPDLPEKRDALLIIPGGGYWCVCTDREGYAIAEAFMPEGFSCFVLNYSVREQGKYPAPLEDASLAMQYIREHADELRIRADRVFAVGFSAGGHLCGMLGTMWHEVTNVPYGINKPTGVMLCYPVLTGKKGHAHDGSFAILCGKEIEELTDEDRALYSLENHVDNRTSPAFLMHTSDDNCVPVESSIYMANALAQNKIPFEMHIYPHGPHGIALANEITSKGSENKAIARWVSDAAAWSRTIESSKLD